MDADVVLHATSAPLDQEASDQAVLKMLRSGKNVISSVGYQYPYAYGQAYVDELVKACHDGGASLHGTGIHPGYLGEILGMTITGLTSKIETVTLREAADCSAAQGAETLQAFGFGVDPKLAQANMQRARSLFDRYYGETLCYLARSLFDSTIDKLVYDSRLTVADKDFPIRAMTVHKGSVALMEFSYTAYVDGKPKIRIEEYQYLGDQYKASYMRSSEHYEVEIEGTPNSIAASVDLLASIKKQLHSIPGDPTPMSCYATALPMINAIPRVVDAPAGIVLSDTWLFPRPNLRHEPQHVALGGLPPVVVKDAGPSRDKE